MYFQLLFQFPINNFLFQANRDAGIREAECEKAAMDVKYSTGEDKMVAAIDQTSDCPSHKSPGVTYLESI